MICFRSKRLLILLLALVVALGALVFLPGVKGPYIFDDYSNLITNSYLRIKSLDLDSLEHASYSLASGPLHRPVAMASFALNYYFAGSFYPSTPYKLTNIILHAINGMLVFWFMYLVLTRLAETYYQNSRIPGLTNKQNTPALLAGAIALLWVVHPVQLTSVLYVVQRMTALAASFTLLSLICYMKARTASVAGRKTGAWLGVFGLLGFGVLGVYSKETAFLIPVFVLILELMLYPHESPWRLWQTLTPTTRRLFLSLAAIVTTAIGAYVIHRVLPLYGLRNFTLTERLMTEGRVIVFYISLILVPRLNEFAMFHDDIVISKSLVDPWTTAPSLLLIAGLLTMALFWRKRYPLFSLGILWFFAGHLLESTFYPLEIAHEHRNYLPSLGVLMAVMAVVGSLYRRTQQKKWLWILPGLAVAFGTVACLRAYQWSSEGQFYYHEVTHHPLSAGSQMGYGMYLMERGQYAEGIQAYRRAVDLNPDEPGFLINLFMSTARHGQSLGSEDERKIIRLLQTKRITATTSWALNNVSECILDDCKTLQPLMETWMKTILEKSPSRFNDPSYNYYLLGRTLLGEGKINEAIDAYRKSYELDPQYLNPMIELADTYIQIGRLDYARVIISEIKRANERVIHPKERELKQLQSLVRKHRAAETPAKP